MAVSEAERQPVLVCTEGARQGERFTIGERGLLLGRGSHCDIILDDQGVSREHARVMLHNDAVWVQDAGSRNGCFVNGRRLVRHKSIAPGDELELGDFKFSIELVDPFPQHDSVSTFGAPPQALLGERDAPTDETPRRSLALTVGLLLLLLAGAAAFALLLG